MPTALDIFLRKHPVPSSMARGAALSSTVMERELSVFVSGVEDVRVTQRLSDFIRDFLAGAVDVLPDGRKVLRVQGKADFVAKARDFMISEGLMSPDDRSDVAYNSNVRNVGSLARLRLVFDVQTRKCFEYARWERGWDADLLDSFPVARFVRYPGAKEPRVKHVANEGVVRLKSDFAFWAEDMNSLDIGGFLTPWAPYGFNSYMSQEDVSRDDAERLGLIGKGEPVQPPDLSQYGVDVPERMSKGTRVGTEGLDDPHIQALLERVKKRYKQAEIDKRNGVEFPYLKAAQRAREEAAMAFVVNQPNQSSLVGGKIAVSGRDADKVEAVKEAISVIDSVHGDGPLNEIKLRVRQKDLGKNTQGVFIYSKNKADTTFDRITIKPDTNYPMIYSVHEVGHFIDLRGLPGEGFSSNSDLFKGFFDAFLKTNAYQRIVSMAPENHRYAFYLLEKEEVWARAYSQYIMEKSQNHEMLTEYAGKKSNVFRFFDLWEREDFTPLVKEIDDIFGKVGWL